MTTAVLPNIPAKSDPGLRQVLAGFHRLTLGIFLTAALMLRFSPALAGPVTAATKTRLANGQATWVLVEFDGAVVERNAQVERQRRGLRRDDAALLTLLRNGYRSLKDRVEAAAQGADVARVIDYAQIPVSAWLVSSPQALLRLESQPGVLAVHENAILRAVSVSDLAFIRQPAALQAGGSGAGTTIAVIDGALGTNYRNYADFGTCTDINTPASTCRVARYQTYYPSSPGDIIHGTNVAAIALGVAPGARLAHYDVFNGASASFADVLSAINSAITLQSSLNIVAINMSLGDSSSHPTTCTSSVFRSAISNARNAGISPVAAAGNSGAKSGLSEPACVPGVVSVGAVYDASYGSISWNLPGGTCTDTSAPDAVTCFSQSAPYLSLLAPGTFVNAPDVTFQQSGTSQATPHVAGAIAVLRARYPVEPLAQTLQRLQLSPVINIDSNGRSTHRLDLADALLQGTALSLSASGPATAQAGSSSSYMLTARNEGPLQATTVTVTLALPIGAALQTATTGCSQVGSLVRCIAGSLASGAQKSFTITVLWNVTGPVSAQASILADQNSTAPSDQQQLVIGADLTPVGDAPLPAWAVLVMGLVLFALAMRRGGPGLPSSAVGVSKHSRD